MSIIYPERYSNEKLITEINKSTATREAFIESMNMAETYRTRELIMSKSNEIHRYQLIPMFQILGQRIVSHAYNQYGIHALTCMTKKEIGEIFYKKFGYINK